MLDNPKFIALSKFMSRVNLPLIIYSLLSIKTLFFGSSWEQVTGLLVVGSVYIGYKIIEYKKEEVLNDEITTMKSRVNMVEQVVNQAGIANIVRNNHVQENGKKRYF